MNRGHQKQDQLADSLPYAGLLCPVCGYNLTGAAEPRCPECGEAFDPQRLSRNNTWWRRRPSRYATLAWVLLAVYGPCSWIFWIDYGWNDYRWLWVKLSPLLPAVVPMAVMNRWVQFDAPAGIVLAAMITLTIIVLSIYVGRRSRLALMFVCLVLLAYGAYNAVLSHGAFRA